MFKSVDVMLPSVRGLLTDSAVELSSVPNFARRRPPDLPVWKRGKTKVTINFFPKSCI